MKETEQPEETVTRTFRVNKEWDTVLQEQADWQGISVSTLLDQIVRRYVIAERFQFNAPAVNMENKAFLQVIEELDEETIKKVASESGRILPEEELLRRGLPQEFDSIVWIMKEVFGRYGGWFTVDQYENENENALHLRHYLGIKWSLYLEHFFKAMFMKDLEVEAKTENREESVTFYIPNRQIKTGK